MRKSFICGNWKMNMTATESEAFVRELAQKELEDVDILIAPPFTSLPIMSQILDDDIFLGAQNVSQYDEGAYTGEISCKMLADLDVTHVLVGHSERRTMFNEDDDVINGKVKKALESYIKVILCVGEEEKTRQEGNHETFIAQQLKKALDGVDFNEDNLTIAYEPIWAIGTGNTCDPKDAEAMCQFIRQTIQEIGGEEIAQKIRILYGGSVKPANISQLMAQENIDGALVGGASLAVEDFVQLINFK